jgi:hypothetical protein
MNLPEKECGTYLLAIKLATSKGKANRNYQKHCVNHILKSLPSTIN